LKIAAAISFFLWLVILAGVVAAARFFPRACGIASATILAALGIYFWKGFLRREH
jgi:hypothetical protein